jgi:very-short-patch-repair endonuclease
MWARLRHKPPQRRAALVHADPGAKEIEVTVPACRWPRRPGIRVYCTRVLGPEDVRLVDRIPVTSPARTLVDIGRFLTLEEYEHVVADAIRRGVVRRTQLIRELMRHRGRRGVATLRAALGDSEPAMTRSAAERRLLRVIRNSSLASPLVNARVGRYEVDFLWPREQVIVEMDGFQWHSDKTAFERDRERDAELQAAGYRVIRVTWRQLSRDPDAVIHRIARVLRRAVDSTAHG